MRWATSPGRTSVDGTTVRLAGRLVADPPLCVLVGQSFSSFTSVLAGVPQGSVLAPLLFLVFINDMFDIVKNRLDAFADDTTLSATISSPSQRAAVAVSLNTDLVQIAAWAEKWLAAFNQQKTELLTISRKADVIAYRKLPSSAEPSPPSERKARGGSPAQRNPHPAVSFCGSVLSEAAQVKIVGITITPTLSWSPHVSLVAKNANRAIALLRRARPFLLPSALSTVYKSHVRSRMEYCCPVWMGASVTALKLLDNVQSKATRLIGPSASVSHQLQSLAHRRGVSGFCLMHRLLHKTARHP